MFCPNCGKELKEDSRFCNKCGAAINGVSDQVRGEASNTPSGASVPIAPQPNPVMDKIGQEKKLSGKVWAVLAIVFGILVFIVVTVIILVHNNVLDLTRNPFSGHSVAESDENNVLVVVDEEEGDQFLEDDIDSNETAGTGEGADSVAEASNSNGNVRHWDEELSVDEYTALTDDWISKNGFTFESNGQGTTSDVMYPYSAIRVDGRLCVICECNDELDCVQYALLFDDNTVDAHCISAYRDGVWGISFDTGELMSQGSYAASNSHWDILDIYSGSCITIDENYADLRGKMEITYSKGEYPRQSEKILISNETAERIMKYHMGDGLVLVDLNYDDRLFDCFFSSPDNGAKLNDILTSYSSVEEAIENAYVINTSLPEDYYDNFTVESVSYQETVSEYILPDSNTRKLTETDLAGLSARELTYARNEIYARHGAAFKADELNYYFASKTWYSGQYTTDEVGSMLSDLERENADFIRNYQDANGLNYKPQ